MEKPPYPQNSKNAPPPPPPKKKLRSYIPFPHTLNVRNNVKLLNDLTDVPYDSSIKFASFGITNMYSNIPSKDLLKIINMLSEKQGWHERQVKTGNYKNFPDPS
jgi:hypothetical protein